MAAKKKEDTKKVTEWMYEIIRQPVVTEKSTRGSEFGQVTFKVPLSATKPDIKAAIEALFNVKVKAVNTLIQKGKTKRFKGIKAFRSDSKKAIISLEEGSTIDVSSGVYGLKGTYKMALKKFRPITPGTRGLILIERSGLHKGSPEKNLTEGKKKTGGRNNMGRITSYHRGGGHKQRYRIIDWKRKKFDVEGTVLRLEYDPNRTAFIALIEYADGEKAYIIAPQRLQAGDKIVSAEKADIKPGNAMMLKSMPVGTIIHNVEMKVGKGGQMCRSAGTYAQLVGRDQGYAQVKLASGELRIVPQDCIATVGAVSNPDHMNQNFGKAGRMRWKGRRPVNRGVAMNPVDHPHGGGEGRSSGGRHPVTPWGKPTKGYKTRTNTRTDKFIIRRKKK